MHDTILALQYAVFWLTVSIVIHLYKYEISDVEIW